MFAKINSNQEIVLHPYTMDNLTEENPHTKFGDEDLDVLYSRTETALNTNTTLVRVKMQGVPLDFNNNTHKLVYSDIPILQDGIYLYPLSVIQLTDEEIDKISMRVGAA